MSYKPFSDIIKKIRYVKAVSEGAEMNEDNKESQEAEILPVCIGSGTTPRAKL